MFFGKIINRIFLIINFVFVFALLLSGISVFVNPAKYWVFAFFSLAFPYLLVANIFFILYWAVQLNRWALLSVACILLNMGHLTAIWQAPRWLPDFFNKKPENVKEIVVLSYNIRALSHNETSKPLLDFTSMLREIKKRDPDIICMQEFQLFRKGPESIGQILLSQRPAKYYYSFINYTSEANEGGGLIILSKYPIVKKYRIDFKNSFNAAMYADVNIDGHHTRIFCVHLQSLAFIKENYDYLDSMNIGYNEHNKKALRKISSKLKHGFILRAQQVEYLAGFIQESKYPVIVCGDFNDTPVSYSYRKMKNGLKDAFRESGHGMGITYNGLAPSFRIDYILFSKSFSSSRFETMEVNYSDHYPLVASLYFRPSNEH